MKQFNRHQTTYTIATIWEFYSLKKINMSPIYQRNSDVWNDEKQSFLIDSIIKNFPVPPIFLHEFINQNTGVTQYDVIDGKQRLTSIFKFIKGEIALPEECSTDGYCDSIVDGTRFTDWTNDAFSIVKKEFWQYQLSVVFIDSDREETINDVFDRLNRNGEPLSAQEFRKAQYSSLPLYSLLEELPEVKPLDEWLCRLDKNRFEDVEFCSELFFSLVEGHVIDSNRSRLDELYEKFFKNHPIETKDFSYYKNQFYETADMLSVMMGDYSRYFIYSVSHQYAMWMVALMMVKKGVDVEKLKNKIPHFYEMIRNKVENPYVDSYIESMKQSTKSVNSRKKRVNSIIRYLEVSGVFDFSK